MHSYPRLPFALITILHTSSISNCIRLFTFAVYLIDLEFLEEASHFVSEITALATRPRK